MVSRPMHSEASLCLCTFIASCTDCPMWSRDNLLSHSQLAGSPPIGQISNPLQAMLDEQLQLSHSRIQGILDTSSRVIAWFETISRRMSVAPGRDLSCIALQCSLAFTSSCRDNKFCMQRYQYTHQEADLSMKGPHTYSLME